MIRAMQPSDLGWIKQTWIRQYRKSPVARNVAGGIYSTEQSWLIDELIPRSSTLLLAADADHDTGLAWACMDVTRRPLALHYIYVVAELRGQGLEAQLLLPLGSGWVYTHWCELARKHGGVFDPYLIARILLGKSPDRNHKQGDVSHRAASLAPAARSGG
jgi:GNAT superfamily N-acetyltransferase